MNRNDTSDENELRQHIRQRLQEKEEQRKDHQKLQQQRSDQTTNEEEYRRILQEEEQSFYADRPDLIEYINELGEKEYCTRDELRSREGYFNYEEKVENTEWEKRKVLFKLILFLLLVGIGGAQLYLYMQNDYGEIAVYSNVKGARILLDGTEAGEVTDAVLSDVTPGLHLLQLDKLGYRMQEQGTIEVDVRKNHQSQISVEMIPAYQQ
jgi:hypothetical protein